MFADYAAAEARVAAWRGPIPKLKQWFVDKEDVHINLAKLIGRVVQASKIKLFRPGTTQMDLFSSRPWMEFTKADKWERDIAKNCNYANNYGVGSDKFALMTGLPESTARLIQEIHFKLMPEIKTGYQRWVDACLDKDSTVTTPFGRRHTFYDRPSPDRSRSAYSLYCQNTVGDLLSCCLKRLNYHFTSLERFDIVTPTAIASCGVDVALQIHDSVGIRCDENDVDEYCGLCRKYGEIPIEIAGDILTIPMDFKVGPSWGEAKDYVPTLT